MAAPIGRPLTRTDVLSAKGGCRAAGHPALDRARARSSRRPSRAPRRSALDLPSRAARRSHHAGRRSGRLEASKRRLKSLERYFTALLHEPDAEPANGPETKKSPPQQGLPKARATGLEPATSGVTDRADAHDVRRRRATNPHSRHTSGPPTRPAPHRTGGRVEDVWARIGPRPDGCETPNAGPLGTAR